MEILIFTKSRQKSLSINFTWSSLIDDSNKVRETYWTKQTIFNVYKHLIWFFCRSWYTCSNLDTTLKQDIEPEALTLKWFASGETDIQYNCFLQYNTLLLIMTHYSMMTHCSWTIWSEIRVGHIDVKLPVQLVKKILLDPTLQQ